MNSQARMQKEDAKRRFISTINGFLDRHTGGQEELKEAFPDINIDFKKLKELSFSELERMANLVDTAFTPIGEQSPDFQEESIGPIRPATLD
jgi:hypothetical protein